MNYNLKNLFRNQYGMIAIMSVIGITTVGLAIVSTLAILAMGNLRMAGTSAVEQTFYAAESGLNEALYRLILDPVPGNRNFQVAGYSLSVAVTANPLNPYQRVISAQAIDPIGKTRTVRITANTSSYAGGFDSAINAGSGGIKMDNGSCVIGNVFSNGPIDGPGVNNNGCKVTTACRPSYSEKHSIISKDSAYDGKVTVTETGGYISGVSNKGDIYTPSIIDSVAGKNAYYQTTNSSKADGGNENCSSLSGVYCHPNSFVESFRELPITIVTVNKWKKEIEDSNIEAPAAYDECPEDIARYCINTSGRTLSGKITGDLYLGNNVTLNLSGNIWVTGNIVLRNNGIIQIDPLLGGLSAVMIADGMVDVNNNITLQGTSDLRSFLLMISTADIASRTGTCSDSDFSKRPAICAMNNSNSVIFSAPQGEVNVKNGGCLNASASELIHLMPNSTVNYNPYLTAFTIPSGGGEQIGAALGTWEEL